MDGEGAPSILVAGRRLRGGRIHAKEKSMRKKLQSNPGKNGKKRGDTALKDALARRRELSASFATFPPVARTT